MSKFKIINDTKNPFKVINSNGKEETVQYKPIFKTKILKNIKLTKENIKVRLQKAFNTEPKEKGTLDNDPYVYLTAKLIIPKHLQKIKLCSDEHYGGPWGYANVKSCEFNYMINEEELGEGDIGFMIYTDVNHNRVWDIYGDFTFSKNFSIVVSKLLGYETDICFTEQGMQQDKIASMETTKESLGLVDYILKENGY